MKYKAMIRKTFIITLFIFVGCQSGKSPYFKEIISTKEIALTKVRGAFSTDSVTLNIPVEFSLNLDNSDIKSVVAYYISDGRQLMQIEDYLVYNSKNNRVMSVLDNSDNIYPEKMYVLQNIHISNNQAELLIKKYNSNASLNNIKTGRDTIKLVTYEKYIKDNPNFIKEMRKKTDSLILSIHFFNGSSKVVGEKIKWLDK